MSLPQLPFILIIFDRYDAEASSHEVMMGEDQNEVYYKHIKRCLEEDILDEFELDDEIQNWLNNTPLKQGRDGLWGADNEEQSVIILPVPTPTSVTY